MIRNLFIFVGTFVVGALIALVVRAARFDARPAQVTTSSSGGEYAPMVTNALTPARASAPGADAGALAKPAAPADPHAGHAATPAPAAAKPVNTVCAICGMDVDPKIPTVQYQGKTVGFGCRMCPPKFKAEPDRYGPVYLRNEVMKK